VTTIETAVMLLAAGRSTRLGPIGLALPKPLAPICGYPPIRFGLAACARAGFREAIINLHHLGDRLRETLGDAEGGLRIRYSVEVELLGTGGGIAHARDLLGGGRVLVINGKVVADVDLRDFLSGHVESGAQGSLLLRDDPDPR
jgi:NDP-sugar pyrophosphorylase family protein